MNILQKFANSNNSLPRNMELFLLVFLVLLPVESNMKRVIWMFFVELKDPDPFIMFDIKEELERICNCKIDLLRLRKNLRSLISQRIARDGIYA